MSVFNEEEFREGLVSELELFNLPSTQTSVNEIYYEEIRPLSAVSGDGPYEFRVNGQHSSDYLDFKNCQLYVRLKVQKADGSDLSAEHVGPANLFCRVCFQRRRSACKTRPASPTTTILTGPTFKRYSHMVRMPCPRRYKHNYGTWMIVIPQGKQILQELIMDCMKDLS